MRVIAAPSTRILAVGTLLSALAFCWLVSSGMAKPRGPRAEYTTLGYNRTRSFFYGTATMPPKTDGSGGFACLAGNRHFPDGPRMLRIYRVVPSADRAISPDIAAGATPENGTLAWKFERKRVPTGRYYIVFEEKIPNRAKRPQRMPQLPLACDPAVAASAL